MYNINNVRVVSIEADDEQSRREIRDNVVSNLHPDILKQIDISPLPNRLLIGRSRVEIESIFKRVCEIADGKTCFKKIELTEGDLGYIVNLNADCGLEGGESAATEITSLLNILISEGLNVTNAFEITISFEANNVS